MKRTVAGKSPTVLGWLRAKWLWWGLRRACVAVVLLAPAPASSGASLPSDRIGVQVRDADGAPVEGAWVTLEGPAVPWRAWTRFLEGEPEPRPPVATAVSDGDGEATLAAPRGLWVVAASAPGRLEARALAPVVGGDIEIGPLVLAPMAELDIRVVDPEGRAVADAVVGFPGVGDPSRWRRTDGRGRAALQRAEGHTVEDLEVVASAPGFAPVRVRIAETSGTVRLEVGTPVTVEVHRQDGRPAPRALVMHAAAVLPLGVTAADGRAVIRLPRGDRLLLEVRGETGRAHGWAEPPRRGAREGGVAAVSMVLEPLPMAAGKVIAESEGKAVPGALVWLDGRPDLSSTTDDRGAFSLPADTRGGGERAQVQAVAPGPISGGAEIAEEGETVVLLPASSALAGRVVDGEGRGVEGAAVEVIDVPAWRPPRWPGRRVRADVRGHFRVAGLPPRTPHRVVAAEPGYARTSIDVVTPAEDEVREGVVLVLSRGATAVGVVLGAGGGPLSGAEVSFQPVVEGPRHTTLVQTWSVRANSVTATTDAEGRFRVEHVTPGRYGLRIVAADHAPLTVPGVDLAATPQPADLGILELEEEARIAGRVVDDRDDPLEGAILEVVGGDVSAGGDGASATGPDGEFVIGGLTAGTRVGLWVRRTGYVPRMVTGVQVPSPKELRVELERGGAVEGRVTDSEGAPVAGATVVARSPETSSSSSPRQAREGVTRSAEDGSFSVAGITPGPVRISARAEGFLVRQSDELELAAGERKRGIRLILERGATITGRVTGPEGEGLPGVHLDARALGERVAQRESSQVIRDRTDALGNYVLAGVAAGSMKVSANHLEHVRKVQEISVPEGGEVRLDFRLERGHDVSGVVTDEAGVPVEGAAVWLEMLDTVSGPDGDFVLRGVEPGAWRMRGEKEGYVDADPDRRVEVEGPVAGLHVTLSPAVTIHGEIRGLPLEQLRNLHVYGLPAGRRSRSVQGTVEASGTYRVRGAGPGPWQVVALPGEGEGVATGEVEIVQGQRDVRLDLEWSGVLRLSGRVTRAGRPLSGARVQAVGRNSPAGATAGTDGDGRFLLRRLVPESYLVTVTGPAGETLHRRVVELSEDRELSIDVETQEVAGRVLDAETGAAVGGAQVELDSWDETGIRHGAHTRSHEGDGSFRFPDVAPGRYALEVSHEGYAAAVEEVLVEPGAAPRTLEVSLKVSGAADIVVLSGLGGVPPRVTVAVLPEATSAAGEGVLRAALGGLFTTGEGGRVRLSGLQPGRWRALITATSMAVGEIPFVVPGAAVPVTLSPEAVVEVVVPAIASYEGGNVRLLDASGRALMIPEWSTSVRGAWPLHFGRATLSHVPAGIWEVVTTATDGSVRRGSVVAVAGAVTEVTLQ